MPTHFRARAATRLDHVGRSACITRANAGLNTVMLVEVARGSAGGAGTLSLCADQCVLQRNHGISILRVAPGQKGKHPVTEWMLGASMTAVEVRSGLGMTRVAPARNTQALTESGIRPIWPSFIVGLGMLTTLAWMALLGWLSCRALLTLIG